MAARGTTKRLSVDHEEWIADKYGGKRSKSSGAAAHDYGDVRVPHGSFRPGLLIECKATMKQPPKKIKDEFEKITREAFAEGRTPALALRYFDPDSILADNDGWVDFIVRRVADDVEREELADRYEDLRR